MNVSVKGIVSALSATVLATVVGLLPVYLLGFRQSSGPLTGLLSWLAGAYVFVFLFGLPVFQGYVLAKNCEDPEDYPWSAIVCAVLTASTGYAFSVFWSVLIFVATFGLMWCGKLIAARY